MDMEIILETVAIIVAVFVGIGIYFAPAWFGRHKTNALAIFALNAVLGWTVVGWAVALAWALMVDEPAAGRSSPRGDATLCRECGKYSEPSSRFCGSCGASIAPARALKVV